MSFIREHLPDLIKSDSKLDSGKLEISGTIKVEKAESNNAGTKSEEEVGLSPKTPINVTEGSI